jgi:hypothetical protein
MTPNAIALGGAALTRDVQQLAGIPEDPITATTI